MVQGWKKWKKGGRKKKKVKGKGQKTGEWKLNRRKGRNIRNSRKDKRKQKQEIEEQGKKQ